MASNEDLDPLMLADATALDESSLMDDVLDSPADLADWLRDDSFPDSDELLLDRFANWPEQQRNILRYALLELLIATLGNSEGTPTPYLSRLLGIAAVAFASPDCEQREAAIDCAFSLLRDSERDPEVNLAALALLFHLNVNVSSDDLMTLYSQAPATTASGVVEGLGRTSITLLENWLEGVLPNSNVEQAVLSVLPFLTERHNVDSLWQLARILLQRSSTESSRAFHEFFQQLGLIPTLAAGPMRPISVTIIRSVDTLLASAFDGIAVGADDNSGPADARLTAVLEHADTLFAAFRQQSELRPSHALWRSFFALLLRAGRLRGVHARAWAIARQWIPFEDLQEAWEHFPHVPAEEFYSVAPRTTVPASRLVERSPEIGLIADSAARRRVASPVDFVHELALQAADLNTPSDLQSLLREIGLGQEAK